MNINKLDLICFNNVHGLHFYTEVLYSWLHHPLGSPINETRIFLCVCMHACNIYSHSCVSVLCTSICCIALKFNATGLWLLSVHYYKQYEGARTSFPFFGIIEAVLLSLRSFSKFRHKVFFFWEWIQTQSWYCWNG